MLPQVDWDIPRLVTFEIERLLRDNAFYVNDPFIYLLIIYFEK